MKKKHKRSFLSKPYQTLLTCLLLIGLPTTYWLYDHYTNSITPYLTPHKVTLEKIPPLDKKSMLITQTFNKGKEHCISQYNITSSFPIYIHRTYQNNRTEYLILRPLLPSLHFAALYDLVNQSRTHIGQFEPQVVRKYASSKTKTRKALLHKQWEMQQNPQSMSLGIFYRASKDAQQEKLIGQVTITPPHNKPTSPILAYSFGAYWIGDPNYTHVRGVAHLAIRALIDHGMYTGKITGINFVIRKDNLASLNIAEKLQMSPSQTTTHYSANTWPYPFKRKDCLIYTLTAKEWKEKHWPNQQPN